MQMQWVLHRHKIEEATESVKYKPWVPEIKTMERSIWEDMVAFLEEEAPENQAWSWRKPMKVTVGDRPTVTEVLANQRAILTN